MSRLLRAQAMLWSVDDANAKLQLRKAIAAIERQLAALDGPLIQPSPSPFRSGSKVRD